MHLKSRFFVPIWLILSFAARICAAQDPQTITFDPIDQKTMLDPPFAILASASSGLPLSISSSDESILSISNGIATIKTIGTVTITVTQAGNANFLPATATQQVTIIKASQSITFDNIDPRSAADSVFYVSARSSSNLAVHYESSDPQTATIDQSGQVRIKKAGTVSITVSQDGNTIYDAATPITHDLVSTKADQVLTLLDDGIERFVFD